jgi:hypothetical protein
MHGATSYIPQDRELKIFATLVGNESPAQTLVKRRIPSIHFFKPFSLCELIPNLDT